MQNIRPPRILTGAVPLLSILAGMLIVGCGGGGGTPAPPPPPPATSSTQIRVGDATTDRVLAYQVTIGNISLTPTGSGSSQQIQVPTNRIDLSHMAGKLEPLVIVNAPQGTYASATVNIANPVVIYLSGVGTLATALGSSQSVTVNFSPALTIGTSPAILNIDINAASTLSTDVSGNVINVTFPSSSITVSTSPIVTENLQQDTTGEIESVVGQVAGISGANFTLNGAQGGGQLVFATDGSTLFLGGLTNLASLTNQIVRIDGTTRADGTLLARRVEGVESQTGSEVNGVITSVIGAPAAFLTIVSQGGTGSGMDSSKIGGPFNINVSGVAAGNFGVNQGRTDFTGLAVPSATFPFDATTLRAGQRISIGSPGSVPLINGTITADKIRLEQQAVTGVVSNFTVGTGGAATFDLTLPSTSLLVGTLTPTVVHVFQQPGTDNRFGTISNTKTVRVRGLLFWTGSTFNMIARRITP
jgi:hypothetical protein